MKINRFIALAVIALLVVGAMGAISLRAFAQTANPPAAQSQTSETKVTGSDNDTVDEQVGEQVEDGVPDATEAAQAKAPGAPDSGVQEPSYAGNIPVDQASTASMSESDEAAALQGQATITAVQAEAAALSANPGQTVVKTELDNENGVLVYSVELSNGSDVKVDAGNGAILFTDTGADIEQ